ncbi:MAG: homoserine kinase [Dehalococcoidia bacterium]|nr:homoserine kinase [Dehalococcoidia bacterium]
MNSVTASVPATSANLGPGFDCLGLALDLWASIRLSRVEAPRADEPMASMALTAARRLFQQTGQRPPQLSAHYSGAIPIARGLGASAVARVGGLLAANALAGEPLDREELLALATDLEGHADNAAPALFGGLQVSVVEGGRVLHTAAPLPAGLWAVLFVPELRMPTRESRRLLPDNLSRGDAVFNAARAALLVAALARGRFDLLDAATQDRLHQPARSQLFPAMFAIFDAAKAAGAHCAYLSGGGSTVCALATANQQGIADAMQEAARQRETPGETIVTRPTEQGAEVMETE